MEERIHKEIAGLRTEIAADLLVMVKKAIAAEQEVAARLNLDVLVQRYSDTPAGRRGVAALETLEKKLHEVAAAHEVDEKVLAAALTKAKRLEANAIKARRGSDGPIIRTVRELKKREKAVTLLEDAWEEIGGLAPLDATHEDVRDFAATKDRIRKTLESEYLIFGTYHVGRRSLPRAEDYNVKACKFGVDHKSCRRLQEIIIQARIFSGVSSGDI